MRGPRSTFAMSRTPSLLHLRRSLIAAFAILSLGCVRHVAAMVDEDVGALRADFGNVDRTQASSRFAPAAVSMGVADANLHLSEGELTYESFQGAESATLKGNSHAQDVTPIGARLRGPQHSPKSGGGSRQGLSNRILLQKKEKEEEDDHSTAFKHAAVAEDGDVCKFGPLVYQRGEALLDERFSSRCGPIEEFPCYCAPDQQPPMVCPYCTFITVGGERLCAPMHETRTIQFESPLRSISQCTCTAGDGGDVNDVFSTPESSCVDVGEQIQKDEDQAQQGAEISKDSCVFTTDDGSTSVFASGQSLGSLFGTKCGSVVQDGDFTGDINSLLAVLPLTNSRPFDAHDYPCRCNPNVESQIECPYCAVQDVDGTLLCFPEEQDSTVISVAAELECSCIPGQLSICQSKVTDPPTEAPVSQQSGGEGGEDGIENEKDETLEQDEKDDKDPPEDPPEGPPEDEQSGGTGEEHDAEKNQDAAPEQEEIDGKDPPADPVQDGDDSDTPVDNPEKAEDENGDDIQSGPEEGGSDQEEEKPKDSENDGETATFEEKDDVYHGDEGSPDDQQLQSMEPGERPDNLLFQVAQDNSVEITEDGCRVALSSGSFALVRTGQPFGRLLRLDDLEAPIPCEVSDFPFVCNPNLLPHGIDYPYCLPQSLAGGVQTESCSVANTNRVLSFANPDLQLCQCLYDVVQDGPKFVCRSSNPSDGDKNSDSSPNNGNESVSGSQGDDISGTAPTSPTTTILLCSVLILAMIR